MSALLCPQPLSNVPWCVGLERGAVMEVAGGPPVRGGFCGRNNNHPSADPYDCSPQSFPSTHLPLRLCLPGETMRIASSEFADDPCSSVKRGTMVRAARALLSAVTRLLILADMADVMRLLSHLKIVRMWNLSKLALWGWQSWLCNLELGTALVISHCSVARRRGIPTPQFF